MFRGSKVAVVIPAYNEADKIAAAIRSVPGFVDHILVVDDASSDGTGAVAQRMGRRSVARGGRRSGRGSRRSIETLVHPRNRGVGAWLPRRQSRLGLRKNRDRIVRPPFRGSVCSTASPFGFPRAASTVMQLAR